MSESNTPKAPPVLRESATFDRLTIQEIQRAAETGIYDIRANRHNRPLKPSRPKPARKCQIDKVAGLNPAELRGQLLEAPEGHEGGDDGGDSGHHVSACR